MGPITLSALSIDVGRTSDGVSVASLALFSLDRCPAPHRALRSCLPGWGRAPGVRGVSMSAVR